jgi:hypothetical protein
MPPQRLGGHCAAPLSESLCEKMADFSESRRVMGCPYGAYATPGCARAAVEHMQYKIQNVNHQGCSGVLMDVVGMGLFAPGICVGEHADFTAQLR